MKLRLPAVCLSSLLALPTASASIVEVHDFPGLNLAIPDGDPTGLANLQSISGSSILSIESVEVSLNISGTFNGDLYGYLQHDSGLAILLNRSGRTVSNSFGYGDDGFSVTLSDSATDNIHTYQDQVTPAAGNPLTGEWQPDGRLVDPALVLDSDDPSTATLAELNGTTGNGDWTLFLADFTGGDNHTLQSWSLEITGIAVPEASESMLAMLSVGGLLLARRRKCTR